MWKRRPWKSLPEINEWVFGAGASGRTLDDIDGSNLDDSDRYLFSRSGPPVALQVWIVPRSWLVAICSGVTLFVGFFVIFARPRFRTTWLAIGGDRPAGSGHGSAECIVPCPRVRGHRRRLDASGAIDRGPYREIEGAVDRRPRRAAALDAGGQRLGGEAAARGWLG